MKFTKTDCNDKKCKKDYVIHMKRIGCDEKNDNSDNDSNFFHCRQENCDDISQANTSRPCSKCGLWMCQNHLKFVSQFDEYEFYDGFCEACFMQWTTNKISSLEITLKAGNLKKDITLKQCNVQKCKERNKLYKCKTCKTSICVNHLIDETGRTHCFLCFEKYLQEMQSQIDNLKKHVYFSISSH